MGKKKAKVNRSQMIRDFIATDPAAAPKAIKAGLAKKGIEVSDSLINAVKYSKPKPSSGKRRKKVVSRPKPGSGKRRRKAVSRRKPAAGETSFDSLLGAKALADKLGGVQRAQKALGMLERLT